MEFVIIIRNVPVHGRALPSGDLSVWHPFNAEVRNIVEPICRSRGYWRSKYNNWVIPKEFLQAVLDELRLAGGQDA